jgi:hypothetical protein
VFTGTPLFVEESTTWYNGRDENQYRDGLWSNNDQITTRHSGTGIVSFLEGQAEAFRPPQNRQAETPGTQTAGNLVAWDFYALGNRGWIRMEPPNVNGAQRPYGWINAPRRVAITP